MTDSGKRIQILSKEELRDLYESPVFSDEERSFYFDLDTIEKKEMLSLNSIESQTYFILQLGYFKAKSMFFNGIFYINNEDIKYILNQYFTNTSKTFNIVSKRTIFEIHLRIMKLLSWQVFDTTTKEKTVKVVGDLARTCVDPKYLFNCVLKFLDESQVVLPGYSTLQDIIGKALTAETKRLNKIIVQNLLDVAKMDLAQMLKENDEQMYGVTLLKRDAKSFNTAEMAKEIRKQETSSALFKSAQHLLPKLKISEQNRRHYAYLVDYYTADRLNDLPTRTTQLYLLCYVSYRFEKINDNLIHGFIYHINSYKKAAKEYSKNCVYNFKVEGKQYASKIGKILDLFTDEKIVDSEPFGDVRTMAFKVVKKEKFPLLKAHVIKDFDETGFQFDYYKIIAKTISRNLRPIVKLLDLDCEDTSLPLMQALNFLKQTWKSSKSIKQLDEDFFPKECISKTLLPYLHDTVSITVDDKTTLKKVFNPYVYEFMIYDQLLMSLESGLIFVNNSFRFKSLAKDLLPDWHFNKKKVLAELNNPMLNTPIKEQLQSFKDEIDTLLIRVNQRIENGENKQVKIKSNKELDVKKSTDSTMKDVKVWTFAYPKKDEIINNPFFKQLPKVNLNQMLRLVNQHCNFMKEITHVKSRYSKSTIDESAVFACITANAANYGIYQMAEISDIDYTKLFSTLKNYVRLETLGKVNNCLKNGLAGLPIFNHWNLLEKSLIAALDGRKVLTRINHILARNSSKYFGQKRGIVSYSMNLNHMSMSGKIISPNDHESHYVYDLIYNEPMQADWYCGDTHSINQVNSSLLRLIDRKFTPHIKNIVDKVKTIGSFNDPATYNGCLIKPETKFNTTLIEEEWDNMQHIYASLLMKNTSQSVVVSKLSSHKRSNKTQLAMWEYDKILMSIHILKFIDDPSYQQAIRGALNRIEGYHQLVAKIGGLNGGKFRGKTESELEIWNECCRVIANCVIYYSGMILSKIYVEQEKLGNTEILDIIKRFSPIAWCHIILDGYYQFKDVAEAVDLEKMISDLVFDFKIANKKTSDSNKKKQKKHKGKNGEKQVAV